MSTPQIHVLDDPVRVAQSLAQWFVDHTTECVEEHQCCAWALSGGKSPIGLFQWLAQSTAIDWPAVQLYLVDERDVFPTDELSNYRMLEVNLLSHLAVPPGRVYPWTTGVEDPRESLAGYRYALERLARHNGLPRLDIALQGMGADGHTASVFPQSPQQRSRDWVAYGPGPGAYRYTLTLPLLANAREVVFLATGQDKAARVRDCLDGQHADLPAAWLSEHAPVVHWFLDRDSASAL
jgi:6-phosphogluconolactonase